MAAQVALKAMSGVAKDRSGEVAGCCIVWLAKREAVSPLKYGTNLLYKWCLSKQNQGNFS